MVVEGWWVCEGWWVRWGGIVGVVKDGGCGEELWVW